ncbi:MAG: hypothetical protein M2R45_04915 [Verrucomicrobia subdivision 3 bacterium]|nr:hypothetical protein [Limisphaerales bacterium]
MSTRGTHAENDPVADGTIGDARANFLDNSGCFMTDHEGAREIWVAAAIKGRSVEQSPT